MGARPLVTGPGCDLPAAALVKGGEDEDGVIQVIGETVIQKCGHYFGLSEEEIEARYWRGEADSDHGLILGAKPV